MLANSDRREALRGVEEETFDIIAQVLTSEKWGEMLKAPLERAARQGNRQLAQKLVRAGAEIGDALHEATRGGHRDLVNDLLENGAPVDAQDTSRGDGPTPLHVAAKEGETEIVQLLLLVKGADKDAMDNDDNTPLHLATSRGHVAAALALMAAGADVTLRCGEIKLSVAHVAAEGGHVDVLGAAIGRGVDVDAADADGWTPLHFASNHNRVEATNMLMEAGVNIEARDLDGRTCLHHAVMWTNVEVVLALLKHGADVNVQDNHHQTTPLHWAARSAGFGGALEVVDSLLRSGADETILNKYGEAAAGVVGEYTQEEGKLNEDAERVRELLANAPADRAWRRRGYLVLCRAHPDRVQQTHESSSALITNVARTTRCSTELARAEVGSCAGPAQVGTTEARSDGGAVVMVMVLGLQEEGIFRAIVGYL